MSGPGTAREGGEFMAGALGDRGLPKEQVVEIYSQLKAQNLPTYGPRMFRPSYFAGQDVVNVGEEAFATFIKENWLYGRTSYPALGELEDEVLAGLLGLFHTPQRAGGIFTSGGTESLLLSVKIARDHARAVGSRSEPYNLVLAQTGHPAFNKAADLLGLEVRRAPQSVECLADLEWMEAACDERTVMIVGSAPPYPFGQIDPIEALSAIAERHGLWLHVDACLGGMILPFLEALGERVPPFDFRVPGVSSLSVDLHKYGYAAKGISALLLRDRAAEEHARTVFADWPAGLYATPGISGTRSGGSLASAWAVMRYLGRSGFVERTREILGIRNEFIAGLKAIEGRILGKPDCYHFNFKIDGVDSLLLAEALTDEGWIVSTTENPASIQLMISAAHKGVAPQFCAAVKALADDIRSGRRKGTGKGAVYSKVLLKDQLDG
jgi:glutamate/tyrosine decarboxylase-like PLP-dependent enzyme